MTSKVKFKKDKYLLAFAGVLLIVTAVLVGLDKVTFKEAAAFLAGALALPGLFGATPDDEDPPAAGGAAIILFLVFLPSLTGCSRPMTPDEKRKAAEGTYGGDLQACVDKSSSPAAADVCAEGVRRKWGVK